MSDFNVLPGEGEEVAGRSVIDMLKENKVTLSFAAAGVGVLGLIAYGLFRRKGIKLKSLSGKWAIITSGTDALGRAMAFELARNGINLILISKMRWNLEPLEAKIRETFPVEVEILAIDFVNDSEYHYSKMVKEHIESKEIDLLINNVGMSPEFNKFLDYKGGSSDVAHRVVKCNIGSVNHMISVILPKMVDQNRGIILNIGSLAGLTPSPLSAVYSATKAYINFLSECLDAEYKDKGIIVQCLNPGHIFAEKSESHPSPSLHFPTPETYVRSALRKIGCGNGYAGYWPHDMLRIWSRILPSAYVGSKIYKDHLKGVERTPVQDPDIKTKKEEKAED